MFGKQLQESLQKQRSLAVQAIPLRDVVLNLQTQCQVAIVLDRRLDPSRRVTLNTGLLPTRLLLQQLAAQLGDVRVSVGRTYIYLGPRAAATRLRTLEEQRRQLLQDTRRDWDRDVWVSLTARHLVSWSDLSEPAEILTTVLQQAGLKPLSADTVPHDLWWGRRLPRQTVVETATLILNQFDLTFEPDAAGGGFRVIPVPERVVVEKTHRFPRLKRDYLQEQYGIRFPELPEGDWRGNRLRLQATLEQHEQVARLLSGQPVDPAALTMPESLRTRLFTLSLPEEVTYRALIDHLGKSGIVVHVTASIESELDQTASVQLKRLPGTEFFPQLFAGLPVTVQVRDREVELADPR